MRIKFFLMGIVIALMAVGVRDISAFPAADSDILLGSPKDAFELPWVKKLQETPPGVLAERYKIDYLILRVKKSPYLFIRNAEEHKGERAAMHFKMKYYKRFELIKTAEKFISDIASFSSSSGEFYLLKYPDGEVYLLKDVFTNELALLNKFLAPQSPDTE